MCVPVPPSVGTKSAGTTPTGSTTQPTSAIDYSRYAGMSPYDVRTSNPNGLPTNWDWNEWMRVNPGAPDPTNHTNTGAAISTQNAALWNRPLNPGVVPAPVAPAAPAPQSNPYTPAPPVSRPGEPGPSVTPKPLPVSGPSPQTALQVDPNTNLTAQASGNTVAPTTGAATYSGANPVAYGPGSALGDAPTVRVSNAMARRFKPEGWF